MKKLEIVMEYVLSRCDSQRKVSLNKLVKMLYLADWKNYLKTGRSLSNLQWEFDKFGPTSSEAVDFAKAKNNIDVEYSLSKTGFSHENVILKNRSADYELSSSEKEILDQVVEDTFNLEWEDFMRVIFDTYPITKLTKYGYIDLSKFAHEYKAKCSEIISQQI